MDVFEAITTRRSTRVFLPREVEQDKLERVIEAGRFAPTGGNTQTIHFTVLMNRSLLDELAVDARNAFAAMEETPGMYKSFAKAVHASKEGGYIFHYNAPVLVVLSNLRTYPNAMADCACAAQNMMLMANALDLGSCWINQLHWLDSDPVIRKRLGALGIGEDETVCASVALGYSKTGDGLPLRTVRARTGNPVTWCR